MSSTTAWSHACSAGSVVVVVDTVVDENSQPAGGQLAPCTARGAIGAVNATSITASRRLNLLMSVARRTRRCRSATMQCS
jgi:hypothetical protein